MKISDLDHLRSNPMIRFKVEEVNDVLVEIVSYMISDKTLWDDPATLEARGNVYDVNTGKCICACFPKFFNVGEREDTMPELIKEQFVECFEKRDGSMITPVLIDGDIFWKTKKSFNSDVVLLAKKTVPRNVEGFAYGCQVLGLTPIFEFTHPDNRIVLDYSNDPNFTLIAIRSNESGNFMSWDRLMSWAESVSIPTVKKYDKTWDEIVYDIENSTNIEGYVLVLKDGRRVKFKTQWYLSMHHTMTDLRERDVAEAVITEVIDDMKSLVSSQNQDITPLLDIEYRVVNEIDTIRKEVEIYANYWKDYSFKEAAIGLKGNEYFSLIMSLLRGKDPDYIDFWKRNHLKTYSLRCVYNLNFGAQDNV